MSADFCIECGSTKKCDCDPSESRFQEEARYDINGRNVTELPGLWDDTDIFCKPGNWAVCAKTTWLIVASRAALEAIIKEHGISKDIVKIWKAT
jgi:hypothetical protein